MEVKMVKKRGRPTIFEKKMTNAEKQSRYNIKKRAAKHRLTPNSIKNLHKTNLLKRITRFAKKKLDEVLLEKLNVEIVFIEKRFMSVAFATITDSIHLVAYGEFLESTGKNDYSQLELFSTKEEALSDFKKLCDGEIEQRWQSIEGNKIHAYNFITKYPKGSFNYFPRTLAFLLAIDEVRRDGFRDLPPSDNTITNESRRRKQVNRRAFLQVVGNISINFKIDKHEVHATIEHILVRCLRAVKGKNLKTTGYRCSRVTVIGDLRKTLDKYSQVINNLNNCSDSWLKGAVSETIKHNMMSKHNKSDTALKQGDSYQPIPLYLVKSMLDYAWQINHDLYYLILLQLLIALRIIEFYRKNYDLRAYITDDNTMDYNEIVKKTDREEKKKKYGKPRVPILARVIIIHHNPSPSPRNFFSLRNKHGVRNVIDGMKPFPERSLRTTAGHMIGKCKSIISGIGGAPEYTIKQRMAHSTRKMELEKYAKDDIDSSLDPHSYFGINGDEIRINGEIITRNSILWDTWLLDDYIEKQNALYAISESDSDKEIQKKKRSKKKIIETVLKEAEIFNSFFEKKEIKTKPKNYTC